MRGIEPARKRLARDRDPTLLSVSRVKSEDIVTASCTRHEPIATRNATAGYLK